MFPEQADNWHWIAEQVRAAGPAAQGAESVCLHRRQHAGRGGRRRRSDARRRRRRRRGLGPPQRRSSRAWSDAPIRWITEDAMKFVRRELKRGNRYDAVILDPPSYGHGPAGESLEARRTSGRAAGAVLRADRRPPPVHAAHLPLGRIGIRPRAC